MSPVAAALAIGFFGGLRALTPAAAAAWAVHLGWFVPAAALAWLGSPWTVGIVTLLALGELVGDKLPSTPARTAPPGLLARIATGALTGAAVASPSGATILGAIVGAVAGVVGCFAGYAARTRLGRAFGLPDLVVALLEDAVTIGGALWVVTSL